MLEILTSNITPQESARRIAERDYDRIHEMTNNPTGQSHSEQRARKLNLLLSEGLCSDCRHLVSDPVNDTFGCGMEHNTSPRRLADELMNSFLYELDCKRFQPISVAEENGMIYIAVKYPNGSIAWMDESTFRRNANALEAEL